MLFDIPMLCISQLALCSACTTPSNTDIYTLPDHYKELKECMARVEGRMTRVKLEEGLQKIEEDSPSQSTLFGLRSFQDETNKGASSKCAPKDADPTINLKAAIKDFEQEELIPNF
jgi:hypothetical protein